MVKLNVGRQGLYFEGRSCLLDNIAFRSIDQSQFLSSLVYFVMLRVVIFSCFSIGARAEASKQIHKDSSMHMTSNATNSKIPIWYEKHTTNAYLKD